MAGFDGTHGSGAGELLLADLDAAFCFAQYSAADFINVSRWIKLFFSGAQCLSGRLHFGKANELALHSACLIKLGSHSTATPGIVSEFSLLSLL